MHRAPRTVSTLISTCCQSRRAIAPIVANVRGRLVIARYSPSALVSCVMAMRMLAPIPSTATPNQARSTFGRTPEAHMAMQRLAAKTTVVTSCAHGSSGAAIEKNTAMMSRSKTMPKRPSTLVRSRSLSRPRRPGGRCLSLTARPCLGTRARYTLAAMDQRQRNLPLELLRRRVRLSCLLATGRSGLWCLLGAAQDQEVRQRRHDQRDDSDDQHGYHHPGGVVRARDLHGLLHQVGVVGHHD